MYTINVLEEIEKSKGFEFALMTTFNIDVDFFERHIIGRLVGAGIKKMALLVDSQELNKGINSTWKRTLLMGSRYSANPVNLNGAFHPKVLLLMSADKARLFVSSANYTKSGYSTNNEIFNVFEWNSNYAEHLQVIQSAYDFFRKAYGLSYTLDPDIFNEIDELPYIRGGIEEPSGEAYLVHNIDNNVISQIKGILRDVTSVDIAVPFYDNGLSAVKEIRAAFPDANINCFVQNHNSRFNVGMAKSMGHVNINAFTGFAEPKSRSFYHGKVFRFSTADNSWVLYGSANCTGAALLSTPYDGGNVECCVLEKGNTDDFNYFFDNMCLQDVNEEVVCDLLEYNSEATSNYYFKYGDVSDEKIVLHIGVSGYYSAPRITYSGESLEYSFNSDKKTIYAVIPKDKFTNWEEILILKIDDAKGEYELKCWLNNSSAIKTYRITESSWGEFDYSPNAEGDERIVNIMRILQNLALGYDALNRKHDIEGMVEKREKTAAAMPEGDLEDAPEGIIDYVIPPRTPTAEEYLEYRNYKKAAKIARNIISAFLYRNSEARQKKIDKYRKQKSEGSTAKKRKSTTAEQQGRRYINAAIRKMCEDESLKKDTAEHFLQGCCQIVEAMNLYSSTFVENMFDPIYIVDKRWDLLNAVLKIDDEFTEEHIKVIIQLAVETNYIELKESNSIVKKRHDYDAIFRKVDDRFDIREDLESIITEETTLQIGDHIEEVFYEPDQYGKIAGVRPSQREIVGFIETALGYRTKKQLEDLIRTRFGEAALISTENRTYLVSCFAPLKEWFNGDRWLINEIESHCRHYNLPIDKIVLDISGIKIPNGPDPANRLIFTKRLGKHYINTEVHHKSGKVYDENGNVIRFAHESSALCK